MIDTIKEFIGLDPIASLQKQTSKSVDIFQKTIQKLTEVNTRANQEQRMRAEEIDRLQEQRKQLETMITGNEKVIHKIQKMFE